MARDPLAPKEVVIDTATQPDDDDPMFDDDGHTFTNPEFDEARMLHAVEHPRIDDPQAKQAPQEAYDLMKFSAPLSEDELEILQSTPFLEPGMTFVDDADHEEWLMNRMRDKRAAFDGVLEDTSYGDESGFGLSSITHAVSRAARGVTSAATRLPGAGLAARGLRAAAGLVKKFVPSRDAQKAAIVKQTNTRLVAGRANFLQMADVRRGVRGRPRSYYVSQAAPWAKKLLLARGLPTSYTTGNEVASNILGGDEMGSWLNPFSWFQTQVKYVVQDAQGQIAEMNSSDFQNWLAQQQAAGQQPPVDPSMDPSAQQATPIDPSMDPSMMDPSAMDPSAYSQGEDRWDRDIDVHSIVEDASRGRRDGAKKLGEIFRKAKAGDQAAAADAAEATKYAKETGIKMNNIIGDDDPNLEIDGEGSFSGFANDVLGSGWRGNAKRVSDSKFRELTMRLAQKRTGAAVPPPAALVAAHKTLLDHFGIKKISVSGPNGEDMMGAWLYKLSPRYWLASSRERRLIDAEKQNWQKTKDLGKKMKGQEKMATEAQRATYQVQQAREAEAKSAELETQLEEAEKEIASGNVDAMGGADATATALEAADAGKKEARANKKRCGAIAAKLEAGAQLSPEELAKLRHCLKLCHHLTRLHDELHARARGEAAAVSTSGYHDYRQAKNTQSSFLGEFPAEILGEPVQEILGADAIPAHYHLVAMTALAATSPGKVMPYAKQHGIKLSATDVSKIRAAADFSKRLMRHPKYGQIKISGDSLGGDSMGFSFSKLITAPLALAALPAAATAWAVKKSGLPGSGTLSKVLSVPVDITRAIARKGGWGGQLGVPGGSSAPGAPGAPGAYGDPNAQRAAIMAARQRQIAAQARINAAAAATAAAQQQYAAQAAAADAEAQAQEAEASAQQAQADSQNPDAMPDAVVDPSAASANYFDQSGSVTVLGADFFSGEFVGEIEDEKAKKIVEEAQKDTPAGKKIRAGATLYHHARKGHKKSQLAITKMQKKAKDGDPQAQRDVNAVRAGKIAVHSKHRASWKLALKARRKAADKKGIAVRKHLEARTGARLGEHTRRKKLARVAHVERLAAHGHKKSKALVAKTVAKAQTGDSKAKAAVAALRLARHVRTSARTPAEAKRLRAAQKVVYKARKGHKGAIRKIRLIHAAAAHGQPNAKRAKSRLDIAARVERAVATGKISPPPTKAAAHHAARTKYAHVRKRIDAGVATREETVHASKLARALGRHKESAELALHARALPSAKQPIKDAATVQAAAEKGNKQAQKIISDTLEAAQAGDPQGIAGAGKLAAVKAVADVDKGRPMPAPIAEATGIIERAHAGDPEAKRIVARAGEAAQDPKHPNHDKAVEAAVALTAASAVIAATAANSGANRHWKDQARRARGQHIDTADKAKIEGELADLLAKLHDGTGTYRDGVRAREIAMALGRPKVAAEISAIMPPRDTVDAPLSSLPDGPEPDITGPLSFLREAARAILLATSDPFANWREGVRTRGSGAMIGRIKD
jgi:hypothetical protein